MKSFVSFRGALNFCEGIILADELVLILISQITQKCSKII